MIRKLICMMFIVSLAGCGLQSTEEQISPPDIQKINYVDQGMKLLNAKKIPEAIASFENAIKQEPENLTNYVMLSQVYHKLGNYEGSVNVLSSGLRLDPNNGEIYFLISQSLAEAEGKVDEAILATIKSIEMFKKTDNQPGILKSANQLKILTTKKEELINP